MELVQPFCKRSFLSAPSHAIPSPQSSKDVSENNSLHLACDTACFKNGRYNKYSIALKHIGPM